MKPSLWLSAIALSVATASIAHANRYVVADYAGKGIDPNKITHVIVAARGTDMGLQFHMTAASQARKLLDVNPTHQVVFISQMEEEMSASEAEQYNKTDKKAEGDVYNRLLVHRYLKRNGYTQIEQQLAQWGFGQFRSVDKSLKTKVLVEEMEKFSKIASLDVYAHSTTFYGLIMDGPFNRVDPSEDMSSLKDNFIPGAYAWFHGCNTGQKIARTLSEQWGIAIAGSYTSTAFQELFFDNTPEGINFYHGYPGLPPKTMKDGVGTPSERRTGVNRLSYKKAYECKKVPCVRMQPDNNGYTGYWGNFREGGLGFYRFTCSSKSVPSREVCYMSMANALINQVSDIYTDLDSSMETFKKAAQDALCPRGEKKILDGYKYEDCAATLEASLTNPKVTLDPFKGKSLNCLPNGDCQATYKCTESSAAAVFAKLAGGAYRLLEEGSCRLINKKDPNAPNRTMVDEYAKYIKGFELLKKANGKK